jgi:hypothetical protein
MVELTEKEKKLPQHIQDDPDLIMVLRHLDSPRKRCPRKLKKKIIKWCGRDGYKRWMSSHRHIFSREKYSELSSDGFKTIDTGRYTMYYNMFDGY